MVCCNLSVVRGTKAPECIECTTFGFKLKPVKTLEIRAFLAAPVCRATVMPAEALVSRAKSYGYLKTFKTLVKRAFPHGVSELAKKTETKLADVSLGLVGRNKVT